MPSMRAIGAAVIILERECVFSTFGVSGALASTHDPGFWSGCSTCPAW
jgi:glyoxylate carboligase